MSSRQLLIITLTLIVLLTSVSASLPVQTIAQVEATPLPAVQPDRCEPDDVPERACVLPLDAISGPFSFLPEGDNDYYSVDLGAEQTGLGLSISIRATSGLDLRTTITRAGETRPLAILSSPALTTTLPADLTGWLLLRIENRSPLPTEGEQYNLELRRVLPPPTPLPDALAAQPQAAPDRLENNWSPETAAPIGVGYVYDLNFVCPVAWGCAGGDHDYLSVPVKAGVEYLVATFDLGPGVDTVIDLFWGDEQVPAATNDDARPGASFLSVLRWRAPGDGTAIIRVGPRTGGAGQVVFDKDAGGYRFAIALAGSDLAHQLEQRIADQTNAPTATPQAAIRSGSSAPPQTGAGPKGEAIVTASATVLRTAPTNDAEAIQTLDVGTHVTLLGQVSGPWARVQPEGAVVFGWVYGPDLRRVDEDATAQATPGLTMTPAVSSDSASSTAAPLSTVVSTGSATATPVSLPRITALEPAPLPPPAHLPARQQLTVAITAFAQHGSTIPTPPPGRPTPTPAPGSQRPLAGLRVQLVNVFGDLLAEAITNSDGRVQLTRDMSPLVAAHVRIPALGIERAVDPAQPTLLLIVPEGARP